MKATIVESLDEFWEAEPGAINLRDEGKTLLFKCPNAGCPDGCSGTIHLPVNQGDSRSWTMTGWPAPTVTPSIYNCRGRKCEWHGWLRNGEWVNA